MEKYLTKDGALNLSAITEQIKNYERYLFFQQLDSDKDNDNEN